MADNSSLPVASGNETFANDDIGSVKYPRVKVTWGPDGTANDTDVASGKPMPIQVRAADGTAVSFAALGQAAMAASSPVVIASNQSSVPVTEASAAAIATSVTLIDDAIVADDAAFTPATTKVMMSGFEADEGSTDSVDEGDGGAARMTLDRKQIVTTQPHAAGGLSIFRSIDLDEGTLEVVKASPGCIYGMWVTNTATATRWIKIYDATSGTAGTGTPVVTFGIPGNASDDVGGLFASGNGIMFATGISVGAVTGVADNDTGAPGANDVVINVFYK